MIYRCIVCLLCIAALQRCVLPKYTDKLKDLVIILLVISALVINNFQYFNLAVFVFAFIIAIIVIYETIKQKNTYDPEYQRLNNIISELQFSMIYYKHNYDDIKALYNDLLNEKIEKQKEISSAIQAMYNIPYTEDLRKAHEQCMEYIYRCAKMYKQPVISNPLTVNIFDDLSSPREIKYLIKELKKLKKDNNIGIKFNNFLEEEIECLEECLKHVNNRTNNKRNKSK